MEYVVEFVRKRDAENPHARVSGREDYLLAVHSGRFGTGGFEEIVIDWGNPLLTGKIDEIGAIDESGTTGEPLPLDPDEVQQRIGVALRRLLDSAGWDRYDADIADALHAEKPVYLTIRSAAAEIYTLPWELLTIESSGQNLFTLPGVFLAYAWPGQPTVPRPANDAEHVLLACSAAGGGVPAAGHLQPLKQTADATGFDPLRDVVLHASCGKLSEALGRMKRAGTPVSALHLLCHGTERDGTFGLLLNGEDGQGPGFVTGADLRQILQPHVAHLRLVTLAACHSSDGGASGGHLGGVAQALHRIGIQWVIGSRYPLSVPGSVGFARRFYTGLFGAGEPLERAFASARRELAIVGAGRDWMSMQLYVRPEHRGDSLEGAAPEPGPDERAMGRLWRVADKPLHYLSRPELVTKIVAGLLADPGDRGAAFKHGLYGMGGIGKSVLAAAVARDPAIRQRFADGIYWLSFGQNPRLASLQGELVKALGGSVTFDHPGDGERQLAEMLADKRVLVILDDVWEPAHAAAFEIVGPAGRLFITTRNLEVLSYHRAVTHRIDVFTTEQSRKLLRDWSGPGRTSGEADELCHACGRLPVALAMVGALLGGGMHSTRRVLGWLAKGRLKKIKGRLHEYERYRNVYEVIDASVDALAEDEALDLNKKILRRCYAELAVFADGELIARNELLVLWSRHGLDEADVDELSAALAARALARLESEGAESADDEYYSLVLHDLQRAYVQARVTDLAELHGAFLDAYEQSDGPASKTSRYYFTRRTYHLICAGRVDALRSLLADLDWLDNKLQAVGPAELIADYERLVQLREKSLDEPGPQVDALGPADAELALIGDALRLSSHVLSRDAQQLAGQLSGRLDAAEVERDVKGPAARLLQQIQQRRDRSGLYPIVPSLAAPGGPLVRTLAGIPRVRAVAMAPDRRYAVSAARGAALSVWDLREGLLRRTLDGHRGWVNAVLLLGGGPLAVSGADDCAVKLWDTQSGELLRTMDGHCGPVTALAATADGRCLVSGSADTLVCVWDPQTGERLRTFSGHSAAISAVAVAPGGDIAISAAEDQVVKVWDLYAGEEVQTFRGLADALSLGADGIRAAAAAFDQVIEIWDVRAGVIVGALHGHRSAVQGLAVSPDGERMLSASADGVLKVWDWQSGEELRTLRGHASEVYALGLSADGRYAISSSKDQTLKVWDLGATVVHGHSEAHAGAVHSIALAADGLCAFSASSDGIVKVWNTRTGELLGSLPGHSQPIHAIAVVPSGEVAVTAAYGDTLQVWDLRTCSRVRVFRSHSIWVNALAVTPDGTRVASAGADGTVKVWNLATGELVRAFAGHAERVDSLAIGPDGRSALSGSRDGTVMIWSLESGAVQHTLQLASWFAADLAVSADGRALVTAGRRGTLRVWNLESLALLRTFAGLPRGTDLAITPDGRYAVISGSDRTVTVRSLLTGSAVCTFTADQPIVSCALAALPGGPRTEPNGLVGPGRSEDYRVIAGDEAGGVHILGLQVPPVVT